MGTAATMIIGEKAYSINSDGNPDMVLPFIAELVEKGIDTEEEAKKAWLKRFSNAARDNVGFFAEDAPLVNYSIESPVEVPSALFDTKAGLDPSEPLYGRCWHYTLLDGELTCAITVGLPGEQEHYHAVNPLATLVGILPDHLEPIYMNMRKIIKRLKESGIKVKHANESIWAVFSQRPVLSDEELRTGIDLKRAREMYRIASEMPYPDLRMGLAQVITP